MEVYFSNPDLLWANEFSRPRFGTGAFAHMVLSLYKEMTGLAAPDFPLKFYGESSHGDVCQLISHCAFSMCVSCDCTVARSDLLSWTRPAITSVDTCSYLAL